MDEPTYELKFGRKGPFDNPLVIEENGEEIAGLDVRIGPDFTGAENVEMNEGVCKKVFDGHHWSEKSPRLEHEPRVRYCVLCDKEQRRVERWEDTD